MTINGTYRPVVGDFDGNGRGDVLWHGSGSTPDHLGWSTGERHLRPVLQRRRVLHAGGRGLRRRRGGRRALVRPGGRGRRRLVLQADRAYGEPRRGQDLISGVPLVGDFDGDGRDDILWYGPGAATDSLWLSTGRAFAGERPSRQRARTDPSSSTSTATGATTSSGTPRGRRRRTGGTSAARPHLPFGRHAGPEGIPPRRRLRRRRAGGRHDLRPVGRGRRHLVLHADGHRASRDLPRGLPGRGGRADGRPSAEPTTCCSSPTGPTTSSGACPAARSPRARWAEPAATTRFLTTRQRPEATNADHEHDPRRRRRRGRDGQPARQRPHRRRLVRARRPPHRARARRQRTRVVVRAEGAASTPASTSRRCRPPRASTR